jgi:hypothetical protein
MRSSFLVSFFTEKKLKKRHQNETDEAEQISQQNLGTNLRWSVPDSLLLGSGSLVGSQITEIGRIRLKSHGEDDGGGRRAGGVSWQNGARQLVPGTWKSWPPLFIALNNDGVGAFFNVSTRHSLCLAGIPLSGNAEYPRAYVTLCFVVYAKQYWIEKTED